jgi:hypothetical protein
LVLGSQTKASIAFLSQEKGGGLQKASAIIQVLQGDASEKKVEDELRNLINNKWNWQVKHVDEKEFTAVFPDKQSLDTFSKIYEILMSVHGLKIKIMKSNLDPIASEVLQSTWVKIYGLPSIAVKEEVIMKVVTLAGEPMVVDELSMIRSGPIRVKVNCRDPMKLRGFVRIFFNKVGYPIRFVSEQYKDKGTLPPSPLGRDEEDEGEDRGVDDELSDDEDRDRKHKRKSDSMQKDARDPKVVSSRKNTSRKGKECSEMEMGLVNTNNMEVDQVGVTDLE